MSVPGRMNKNKLTITALIFLICCSLLTHSLVQAAILRAGVIYPQSATAFKRVFEQIIAGIHNEQGIEPLLLQTNASTDVNDVEDWVDDNKPDVVITLGSSPIELVKKLRHKPPVVSGAVLGEGDDTYGLSLAGQPLMYLARLKQLSPATQRVFLVYHRQYSQWLIPESRKAASKLGIELLVYPVESTKEGVLQLDRVIEQASGMKDAIWLLNDGSVSEKISMPRLLQASWNKQFLIFGGNPLQVKKGILFALYPDYIEMGQQLVKLARHKYAHINAKGLQANTALKSAINKRTASHLDLSLGRKELNEYDLVFPTR